MISLVRKNRDGWKREDRGTGEEARGKKGDEGR